MTNPGDAAEQVVRLSLEGFEVAARLTGSAAKNIAILLASVLKQEATQANKTRGKARLTNMIKSGKELKVFSIPNKDLKAILKDNTSINIKMAKENKFIKHRDAVNVYSIGLPVFNIDFSPNVKGLPENIQKNFNFVVTELGYVIPNDNDMCLWKLQNENWLTTAETFNTAVCRK